jgi:heme-degrading monooxygenase HmoA
MGATAPVGERGERRPVVYARVSTLGGSPEQIDELLRDLREEVLPTRKEAPGFKGLIALGDRQSGKTLSITLWESEDAMRATEQEADQQRSAWAETSGQQIVGVETYEVGLFEVDV